MTEAPKPLAFIFVLHCFEKKSQRTRRPDIDLATRRYKDLVKELKR